MHTYHICTWLCGGRTVFNDAQLDWHGCTGEVRDTDTSMEAVGVRVVRVGKAGDGAVCQATCLVQSSGIWSNVASTWSIWPVQRMCLPDHTSACCFVARGLIHISCELYIQFVLHFMLALYHGGPQLCIFVHTPECNIMADDTHTSTSTKHGEILGQHPIGERRVACVPAFSRRHTLPRNESCMLNLESTM